MTPKIIIAALICFFPTLVNMVRGLKAVSPATLDLMRVLSASKSEMLWKVRFPEPLPFLFAALKIAATTCVIGAIVGEWIGSSFGLGALIIEATYNFRSPLLYATVLVAAGLAVGPVRHSSRSSSAGSSAGRRRTDPLSGAADGIARTDMIRRSHQAARQVPVVDRSDVVVVGGGPAGIAAAVSAARNGASVRCSSAIPISAASPPAAWCWCSTTCTTAPRSPCAASAWR